MMNVLQPKKAFQTADKVKREFRTVVLSENFHWALTYALAEFVLKTTPSADQLAAVRAFILVLLNLGEDETPTPIFPTKTLDYAAYERGHLPPTEQTDSKK